MIRSVTSRHQTIADDLRSQISAGLIKAGERLPSEAQLADRYTVSKPTLRSALAILQGEGLVEKVHGRGNFILPALHRVTYVGGALSIDARAATNAAMSVSIRTANVKAEGHLSALLRVSTGALLAEYICLTQEGRTPHSLARVYVPQDLVPTDAQEPSASPWGDDLGAWLAGPRPPLAEVREKVTARLPTSEEARTLRISSALAVLDIERVTSDSAGRVVEAALLVLPGDRADALFTTSCTTTDERGTNG
ncbi:GntR family transcriptional regulator [Streptomyces sp. NBC_01221]|uniref:GntR family transcriptional regulator n=1 Tax=Streptomyces sp. NBC_01221 TaxID=2903782 RepID=UPI00224DB0D8|nr:GntR family transcriptional regulator [Streptomyces sp. NBC_01221]MCX4787679.1 GntR family transcriptional regulator [Streptomyces sp. NBC_01221]